MPRWCGAAAGPAVQHWTLSPCWFETGSPSVVLVLCLLTIFTELRRLKVLRRHRVSARANWTGWDELALIWCPVLTAIHLGWLTWLVTEQDAAPVSIFYEAVLSFVFASLTVVCIAARLQWCRVHFHWVFWPAFIMYAATAYNDFGMYYLRWGWLLEAPLVRGSLAAVQMVIAVAGLLHHALSGPSVEEEDVLRESLLQSVDVRDSEGGKKSQGWIKLTVLALAYVWPDTAGLKLRTVVCLLLVASMRGLNLMVPVLYANTINQLSDISQSTGGSEGHPVSFDTAFLPWCFYWLLAYVVQGGGGGGTVGLINNCRQYLWIPVTQRAYQRISVDIFVKTMDLDLSFHLKRKTGEVMRIMDRGTSAIQNLLSIVIFNIGPQMFDIVFASIFICYKLTPWVSVVVFVTLASYIPLTIVLTEWRGKYRRDMNTKDNAKGARATDALLNYETVKYFTNEELERTNFTTAIDEYQTVEFKLLASLNILNIIQSLVICSGLVCGMIVCVKGVAKGALSVGDAVLFVTMLNQLYAPLNFFGTYYRTIQQYMIDMENMFELLRTNSAIKDAPDATELAVTRGTVDFSNVIFSYINNNPVLKGISFCATGGKTMALVGETGSGKSTVLRLIFRFYDPNSGAVLIDGTNINSVTQHSLRKAIGVVPQDTVLFNDTIGYNIAYGKPNSDDKEVQEAAKAAKIHGPISERFPLGYETIVGERGLRLSGGEKQRVAVARTLLKNPPILLLDEATSALDTITEKAIQAQLSMMRDGRTTIIIAHRLSTVMDADNIVVMHHGEVVESGTHEGLLETNGRYCDMWTRQAESGSSSRHQSKGNLQGMSSS